MPTPMQELCLFIGAFSMLAFGAVNALKCYDGELDKVGNLGNVSERECPSDATKCFSLENCRLPGMIVKGCVEPRNDDMCNKKGLTVSDKTLNDLCTCSLCDTNLCNKEGASTALQCYVYIGKGTEYVYRQTEWVRVTEYPQAECKADIKGCFVALNCGGLDFRACSHFEDPCSYYMLPDDTGSMKVAKVACTGGCKFCIDNLCNNEILNFTRSGILGSPQIGLPMMVLAMMLAASLKMLLV